MERADPTVWSVDAEGPMDGATIAAYDRRGFSEVDGPAVIFVVFNSVENALVEPFSGTGQRPTFIANREFVPVTR